jgi:PST family polysaccharide transporter
MKLNGLSEHNPFNPSGDSGLGTLAARSSIAVGIGKIIRYGFVFIVHILLMNLIEPGDFGLVRYVTIILGILNLVNEAGLSIAIVQKKEITTEELGAVFTLNCLLSFVLYLIAFAAAPLVASFFSVCQLTDLLRIGTLAIPLGGISVVHRAVLQRQFKYGHLSAIEIAAGCAGSCLSVICALKGYGAWSIVYGTVAYHAFSTVLLFATGGWFSGYFRSFKQTAPLFFFGLITVLQRIISYCASNVDYLVVGKSFGSDTLGIYGVAYDLITLPQMALGVVLANVALSAFSRFQDDDARMQEAFLKLTLTVAVVATPFLVFAGAMAEELMQVVTFLRPSDTWLPAAMPIRILAPVGLLYAYTSYPGIVWIAKGKTWLRIGWISASFITVVIAVLIGRMFGLKGICVSLLIRAILLFPAMLLITRSVAGFSIERYIQTCLVPAVCGLAMLAAVIGASSAIKDASFGAHILRLSAGAAAGLAAYVLVLYAIFKKSWQTIMHAKQSLFFKKAG